MKRVSCFHPARAGLGNRLTGGCAEYDRLSEGHYSMALCHCAVVRFDVVFVPVFEVGLESLSTSPARLPSCQPTGAVNRAEFLGVLSDATRDTPPKSPALFF